MKGGVCVRSRLSTSKYFQESNKDIEGYNKLTTTIKATIVKKMIFLAFCEKITVGATMLIQFYRIYRPFKGVLHSINVSVAHNLRESLNF